MTSSVTSPSEAVSASSATSSVLVLVDDDEAQRLCGGRADGLTLLGGPGSDPLVESLRLADLAAMLGQGCQLPVERLADVDPDVRAFRPEEVQAAHGVGGETAPCERREGHRVAGGRIHGVDGGDAGGSMIGVVHATAAVEDGLGVGAQDRVGPERPDLADELLAQRQVVGECPIRLVQEGHAFVADDGRGGALLALA